MKHLLHIMVLSVVAVLCGCESVIESGRVKDTTPPLTGSLMISSAGWTGDIPVTMLKELQDDRFDTGIGVVTKDRDFDKLWQAYSANRPLPQPSIDFTQYVVIFIYDPHYYNFCKIVQIDFENGIGNILMSSSQTQLSLQTNAYVSMLAVPRKGVRGFKVQDDILRI